MLMPWNRMHVKYARDTQKIFLQKILIKTSQIPYVRSSQPSHKQQLLCSPLFYWLIAGMHQSVLKSLSIVNTW